MYTNEHGDPTLKIISHIIIALVVLILIFGTVGTVSAGFVGVKTRFSAVVG